MAAAQLKPLPEVTRLSERCIRILGGNPGKFTLQGTNTYLLGTGRRRLLIDTGEGKPSWIAALKRTLQSEGEGVTVSDAIITHWHHDHIGGVAHLLREVNPDANVYKHTPSAVGKQQQAITDGQEFRVEGATLRAVHTPGHTADHVVLVLEEEDAMFTGDNVLGHGTAVFEDLGVYMVSLARMRPLFKGRAYPGHGHMVEDGPARVGEYIVHRRQREDQVVQTLRAAGGGGGAAGDGAMNAMELVKVIYSEVPEALHPAAEKGVLQILAKLRGEEKVLVDDEGRWRLKVRSPL